MDAVEFRQSCLIAIHHGRLPIIQRGELVLSDSREPYKHERSQNQGCPDIGDQIQTSLKIKLYPN
jgi:hypothetical protein